MMVLRWIAVVPGAWAGATAIRFLLYPRVDTLIDPTGAVDVFYGLGMGAVFVFALGYCAARIAPAHKHGTALVLTAVFGVVALGGLGLSIYVAVTIGIPVEVDVELVDWGELIGAVATAGIVVMGAARGKDVWSLRHRGAAG